MRAIGDINAETFFPSDDEMPAVYWDGRDEQFITVYNGDEYKSVGTAKDWRTGMMTAFFQIHGKTQTRATAMPILHWDNTVSKRVLKKPSSNTEGVGGGGSKGPPGGINKKPAKNARKSSEHKLLYSKAYHKEMHRLNKKWKNKHSGKLPKNKFEDFKATSRRKAREACSHLG